MKLIDADKLKIKHFVQRGDQPIGYEGTQPVYEYTDLIAYDVDNAPTVEAIPIEWIEKYLEPYKEHFNKLSDKSKETSGAGWVIDVLESMLREWEKENE